MFSWTPLISTDMYSKIKLKGYLGKNSQGISCSLLPPTAHARRSFSLRIGGVTSLRHNQNRRTLLSSRWYAHLVVFQGNQEGKEDVEGSTWHWFSIVSICRTKNESHQMQCSDGRSFCSLSLTPYLIDPPKQRCSWTCLLLLRLERKRWTRILL